MYARLSPLVHFVYRAPQSSTVFFPDDSRPFYGLYQFSTADPTCGVRKTARPLLVKCLGFSSSVLRQPTWRGDYGNVGVTHSSQRAKERVIANDCIGQQQVAQPPSCQLAGQRAWLMHAGCCHTEGAGQQARRFVCNNLLPNTVIANDVYVSSQRPPLWLVTVCGPPFYRRMYVASHSCFLTALPHLVFG